MSHSTRKPKCPSCHQEVFTTLNRQCVACPLCSKVKRRVCSFCWDCQREWPSGTPPDSTCTQPNCAIRASLLSDEQISDPSSSANGCPYFRACPGCNALLTHNGQGCPNIECPHCHTEFCFCCLRTENQCPGFSEDESDSYISNDDEYCTIVDNSQSLLKFQ